MSKQVTVKVLPKCAICGKTAHYDARTYRGFWGYFCEVHFTYFCVGLGTGKGQRLIKQ